MNRPDRLVILGASLTALAVARSAARRGIEPWVIDVTKGPAYASRLAKRVVGNASRGALMARVEALGRERDSWLVSTADAWSLEIIERRPALERAFAKVLQPSNDVLAICLSKTRFAEWCDAHDVPSPRHYRVDPGTFEIAEEPAFPALVRPALTQHAGGGLRVAKAREVGTAQELRAALQSFRDADLMPAISESLLGRNIAQISVGVAMAEGRSRSVVARKVRPAARACRVGTLVETVADAAAEEIALSAMRKLGYEGIAEVEILEDLDTGRMDVIEINARPWIQFGLAEAAGRDLLGFFFGDGEREAAKAQSHRLWLDFSGDLWNCFNRDDGLVRKGAISFREYCRSLLRARVHARWNAGDPGPFLADAAAVTGLVLRGLRSPRSVVAQDTSRVP